MALNNKPPTSFWIIATFAIFWNIMEIYFSSFEINYLESNISPEEFNRFQSLPVWYIIAFLIALFSEMLGSFMLFMRKKIAKLFFAIALIVLVFIEFYWLIFFDIKNVSILFSIVIPIIVIAIATFLYFYSKYSIKKGWID
ncbi:hypothetical protein [Winogradskyella forsetii]|uniref:hypothetical protein n=1 Tax=Winogradskyella forsetii TaxID=2686077 RepID=UPI0015BA3E85|nr:hypothetical protein [Winogradskyella forsetii]